VNFAKHTIDKKDIHLGRAGDTAAFSGKWVSYFTHANVRLRLTANRTYGLAVGYTLLDAWIKEDDQPATAVAAPPKAE
jgi:hypothetical protein